MEVEQQSIQNQAISNLQQYAKKNKCDLKKIKCYGIIVDFNESQQLKLKVDFFIKLLQKLQSQIDSQNDIVLICGQGILLENKQDLITHLYIQYNPGESSSLEQKVNWYTIKDALTIISDFEKNKKRTLLDYIQAQQNRNTNLKEGLDIQVQMESKAPKDQDYTLIIITDAGFQDIGSNENELGKNVESINYIRNHQNKTNVMVFYVQNKLIADKNLQQKQIYDYSQKLLDGKFGNNLYLVASSLYTSSILLMEMSRTNWKIVKDDKNKLIFIVNEVNMLDLFPKNFMKYIHLYDALICYISQSSIYEYINGTNRNYKPPTQRNITNMHQYDNGCAAALHLALSSIGFRNEKTPSYEDVRKYIENKYKNDTNKPHTYAVIYQFAQEHRLYSRRISESEAKFCILRRQCVPARISLELQQWEIFLLFFEKSPKGILNNKYFFQSNGQEPHVGLTVNLVGYDANSLIFFNSWGDKWGDNGFFRIQCGTSIEIEYYELHQDMSLLTEEETKELKSVEGKKYFMNNFYSVGKQLPIQEFTCSSCSTKYDNNTKINFLNVTCGQCKKTTPTHQINKDLQAYQYLEDMISHIN